ncbi:MAG: DUF3256 family protein [Prevotellaceae bacterium]|nr:DUF3256 family protein [Prevotellaceae bacterium]
MKHLYYIFSKGRGAALALALVLSLQCVGQEKVADAFVAMPDSLLPCLTRNNRLDMVDFAAMAMKAEVTNKFDEPSELTRLTDSYLCLRVDSSCVVEMKLVPADTVLADSSACKVFVLTTVGKDTKCSCLNVYSGKWQLLATVDLGKYLDGMVECKNKENDDDRLLLNAVLSSSTVFGRLSESDNAVEISPCLSLFTNEEKEVIKKKLLLRTLKINL